MLHWQHSQCHCINWFMQQIQLLPQLFVAITTAGPIVPEQLSAHLSLQTKSGNYSRWKQECLLPFCAGSSHGYMHVRTEVAVAQVREWKNPTPSTGSLASLQNSERASNDKHASGEGSWTQWDTSPFFLHEVQPNCNKPLAKRFKSCIKCTTEALADALEYFWLRWNI